MSAVPTRTEIVLETLGLRGRHRVLGRELSRVEIAAIVVSLVLFAVALRLFRLDESFDLFVDEITYLRLGQGVSAGHLTPTLYGEPFFLHPPLFFYIEGAFLKLFGADGGVFAGVRDMRILNLALSGLTAASILLIGRRIAGLWAGLAAALVFVADPFAIRINSRVLLETAAVFFIVTGFLVLGVGLTRVRGVTLGVSLAAGALFGLAILTKEVSAVVTIGPLLLMGVLGYAMPRQRAFTTAAVAAVVYALYPVFAVVSGQWSVYLEHKQSGILRFTGSLQTTGFNRQGSAAFTSRLVELVGSLGTTYLLLAFGVGATIALLWKGTRAERVLASWAAGSYTFAGYSIVAGTLEEQLFYFVVVPAILVIAALVAKVVQPTSTLWRRLVALLQSSALGWSGRRFQRKRAAAKRRLRRTRITVAVFMSLFFLANFAIWLKIHTEPDDAHSQLLAYMTENVSPGASIAVGATSVTAEFILGDDYVAIRATSVRDVQQRNVDYVILGTKSIEDGSVFSGIAEGDELTEAREHLTLLIEWLGNNGEVVFSTRGRSTGTLILHDVRAAPG